MPRHLLPKHQAMPTGSKGEWLDFQKADFESFANGIEISKDAVINVTSIPSPWARMLLFKEATANKDHPLHLEIMSNILDVLEIIFFNRFLNLRFVEKEILIQGNCANKLIRILNDLRPGELGNTSIYLLIATLGVSDVVLAGSSPYTLFFTPLNLKKDSRITRYFKKLVYLKDRPRSFQYWIQHDFLHSIRTDGNFGVLVDAFHVAGGIMDDVNVNPEWHVNTNYFNNTAYPNLLHEADTLSIVSSLMMKPSKETDQAPLVIDPSTNLENKVFYEFYRFLKDFDQETLDSMPRDQLPGELMMYPWVLPQTDFLQKAIIKYRYNLNSDLMMMGNGSDSFKYLLPLTMNYFKYFSLEDANKYLKISDQGGRSVRVELTIPLQDGRNQIISKTYFASRGANQDSGYILEFDDKDANTPLPHLILWPKLKPEQWNMPYYGFSYGHRHINSSPVFDIHFLNEEMVSVLDKHSRRSRSVEVFRYNRLPHIIVVEHAESRVQGMLLLDHESIPPVGNLRQGAVVGLDFGTSHTSIAIKDDNNHPILLKYSSNHKGKNLNKQDFIPCMRFKDNQIDTEQTPILIRDFLKQYFLPNMLGVENNDHVVNFPLPSVINTDGSNSCEALISASVNFSKFSHPEYKLLADQIKAKSHNFYNLKWDHSQPARSATEEYLKVMLLLVQYELIKRGYDPHNAEYRWAYPKAFSDLDKSYYSNLWMKLLILNAPPPSADESKAALMYFDHVGMIQQLAPSPTIVIDIGGGSSDVSIWQNGNIRLLYSTLWAGRNLVGFQDNDTNQSVRSVIYNSIKTQYPQVADRYKNQDSFHTQLNYILASVDEGNLLNFVTSDAFFRGRFLILYFFSSLLYEIGLQSRRFIDANTKDINICLAGNGSRFASWSNGSFTSISTIDAQIYSAIIKESFNLKAMPNINFIVSQERKSEVAIGLCEGTKNIFEQDPQYQAVIAEKVQINVKALDDNTAIVPQNDDPFKNSDQLMIDKDASNLYMFHELFFNNLKNSDLYRQVFRNDNLLCELDKVESQILDDWNGLIGAIRQKAKDNTANLGSLSSSLFILGMQVAIKRLHRYLDLN